MLINSSCSNIYFDKKFYEYPIKINFDTIKKIGFLNLIKIGFSYLKVLIKKREEINLVTPFLIYFFLSFSVNSFENSSVMGNIL